MSGSGFFINFRLSQLEDKAQAVGFSGPRWKQAVLEDLLFDGKLKVWKGHDQKEPTKPVWFAMGRKASIACSVDAYAEDAFFCIGIVPGPEVGGPRNRGQLILVPGPWEVETLLNRKAPAMPLENHLETLYQAAVEERLSEDSKRRPLKKRTTTAGSPLAHNPFKALGNLLQGAQRGESLDGVSSASPTGGLCRSFNSSESTGEPIPTAVPVISDDAGTLRPALDATLSESDAHLGIVRANVAVPQAGGAARSALQDPSGAQDVEVPLPDQGGPEQEAGYELPQEKGTSDGIEAISAAPDEAPYSVHSALKIGGDAIIPISSAPPSPGFPEIGAIELAAVSSWDELAGRVLTAQAPALEGLIGSHDPRDARRRRIDRLEAEIAALTHQLEAVPDEEFILEAEDRRRRVVQHGMQLLATPPSVIRAEGLGRLERVLSALADGTAMLLPEWVLGQSLADKDGITSLLGSLELQARLCTALDWVAVTFAGAPPNGLDALPEPGQPGSIRDQLDRAWRDEQDLRKYRGRLPEECIAYLRGVATERVDAVASALLQWRSCLSTAAFEQMVQQLRDNDTQTADQVQDPRFLDEMNTSDLETLKEIGAWERALRFIKVSTAGAPAVAPREPALPQGQLQRFDHVVTDERGLIIAAPLVVPEAGPGSSCVLIDVPVRFTATSPLREDLVVMVQSPSIAPVPIDAVIPSPGLLVRRDGKRVLQWTLGADPKRWETQDSNRAFREEVIKVPVTLGFAADIRQGRQTPLSLTLSSGSVEKAMRFERIQASIAVLGGGTGLGNDSASQLIAKHALGAQVDHSKLEDLVEEGRQAFMVVAPRRFGKTTLFLHLASRARTARHEVVLVSLERDLSPEQGLQRVWQSIRQSLEEHHGMAPAFSPAAHTRFDDEASWRSIRKFIKDRGHEALVLLIDEAQVLVPRVGGERWGNHFKNFMERYLGQPTEGMARVQVGLFGTVDLAVRVGQNCRDFLLMHGTQQHAFDETSLARFLRSVSQGAIVSSRRARESLVRWTNNLRTLFAVLERIRVRLGQNRRLFMLDLDVEACIRDMLSPDSQQAEEIWGYVRAELSHRDEWEPVDSFPLAVAWAREEMDSLDQPRRLEACVEWLNNELAAVGASGKIVRERIDSSLRDLKARGVLKDDGAFWRPLLHELLRRRQQVLRHDYASQHALMRLAVDSVVWPDALEQKDEGGQARILMVFSGNRNLAYRVCTLETEEERRRFARTCAAIRTLKDRRTRVDGDRHLPRVTEAGFRADDPSQGVIVYDWVEGERLDQLQQELSSEARVHVVRQIARAVQALHGRDVIHCDVAPRNILVDSRMTATLIDFGLARRTDSTTFTQLGGDPFKAPEQCGLEPWAGKKSDIYALGVLLRGAQDGADLEASLRHFTEQMVQGEPEGRPDIDAVVARLGGGTDFDLAMHNHRASVEDIINDAPEWLWEDLLQFAGQAANMRAGLLKWDTNRAMEAAHILNNLFARIVDQKQGTEACALADLCLGDEISLARVSGLIKDRVMARELPRWLSKEVTAVGLLRIAWSHPTDRRRRLEAATELLGARSTTTTDAYLLALEQVAALLDGLLGGGTDVVRRFIGAFSGTRPQPVGAVRQTS